MTARQRQASGIPGTAGSAANGEGAGLDRSPGFSWEDWFLHANAQQRADALGLAQRQGVVYPHQLPHLSNGTKPLAPETGVAPTLTRILAGKSDTLPSIDTPGLTFVDAELDEFQQQAVLRAIGTPDVFLLQGLPGSGKSRVAAEILRQAAGRGWRVLFLAGHPASLDVVLERLAGRPDLCAIRYLEPGEKPAALSAAIQGCTLDEQRRSLVRRVLAGALGNREEVEARCRARRDEEPVWAHLHVMVAQANDLDRRIRQMQERLPQRAGALEGETESAFAVSSAERRRALEQNVQELDSTLRARGESLAGVQQESEQLARRIADLEPGYRAKNGKQFWTLAFWLHLFSSQILRDMESARAQHAAALVDRQAIEQEIASLQERRRHHQDHFAGAQAAALADELLSRQQAWTQEIDSLQQARRELLERWTSLCQRLSHPPLEPTLTATEAARQAWLQHKKNDDEQCHFARRWSQFVEETGAQLAARLPMVANVIAGTMTAWQMDAAFRDAASAGFDLLIVEDADTLTEADLLKAGRQAQRCVLVANALAESAPAPKVMEKSARSFAAMPIASVAPWPRLWQTLGGDARAWPCRWFRDEGRLTCQLLPLTKDDAQHLDTERLADADEIELRILHRPNAIPCLAQIVFPAHWSSPDALAFVVREAQEVPIQPLGRTTWWREERERWHWQAAPSWLRVHAWLDVETGVRLGTVPHADLARIARIEFDKSAGWDRSRAEAWLHRHQHLWSGGRTLLLQTPHRFSAPLAKTITSLICPNDWFPEASCASPGISATFEFMAVPPSKPHEVFKDGAGLELDLSATRHLDRLPSELRQGLPARGFVNYLEAQALVRRLESLVQSEPASFSPTCRVSVLALYESQAELLRRMIARSEPLRSRSFALDVALPTRMHQREADMVFLSLTRSQAHRCVAFGEDVRELPLALTRARTRLFVFGDPGMLCRRAHWTGPLDHLDAQASHQELQRIVRLFALAHPPAKALSNGAAK